MHGFPIWPSQSLVLAHSPVLCHLPAKHEIVKQLTTFSFCIMASLEMGLSAAGALIEECSTCVSVSVCGGVGWQIMPEDTHLTFSNFSITDCQVCLMWVVNLIGWLTTVFTATFCLCPWHHFQSLRKTLYVVELSMHTLQDQVLEGGSPVISVLPGRRVYLGSHFPRRKDLRLRRSRTYFNLLY